MMIDLEIWKPILGFEGRYEVSNVGRVRGLREWGQHKAGRIRKLATDRRGYRAIGLDTTDHHRVMKRVHRLVMEAFHGADERTVNHKDGNKKNNCLGNLEYLTHKENVRHAHANGLCSKTFGEKHWRAKLSDAQVSEMAAMERDGIKHRVIAEQFGIRRETVSTILRRRYANSQVYA